MIENVLLIAAFLWAGGVAFVSVCMGILKAFDILENKYD
jgi:hypothetical protein